jgi:molybdopterin-guanine dinucleotide biosynthesis protein A
MGRPKEWLPFDGEVLLQRVVRILGEVVSPIVVVAARNQGLPPLPATVRVVSDEDDFQGPLAGLAVGLQALREEVTAAYVTACDVPFLQPAFVHALLAALGDHDLVMARDGDFLHPLAAVYRVALEPRIRELLAAGRRRPVDLREVCRAGDVEVNELRRFDPELASLRNLNTPEEYAAALRKAEG